MTSDTLREKIAALRVQFIERLGEELALMESLLQQASAAGGTAEHLRELKVVAHRLAGSAGRFEFHDLSDLGVQLENHTASMIEEPTNDPTAFQEIRSLIDRIGVAIEQAS